MDDGQSELGEGQSELRVLMGRIPSAFIDAHPDVRWQRGDTRIIWSRDNADEVKAARRTYDDLVKKGFAAFKAVGKEGTRGEQIDEFDPNAERLILVPPLRGG